MAIATSFAQLKVDSLGRTAIGYLGTPQSQLSIGSSGNSNYVMSLYNNNKMVCILIVIMDILVFM